GHVGDLGASRIDAGAGDHRTPGDGQTVGIIRRGVGAVGHRGAGRRGRHAVAGAIADGGAGGGDRRGVAAGVGHRGPGGSGGGDIAAAVVHGQTVGVHDSIAGGHAVDADVVVQGDLHLRVIIGTRLGDGNVAVAVEGHLAIRADVVAVAVG